MSSSNETAMLPSGFTPGEKDVIVGRGKVCYKHSGNQRLTDIVQSVLVTYSAPEATKKSKSELIKSIMIQVRKSSPTGGFVKFDSETGHWFEVGDRIAREKVSQTFRDALNDKYKSSTTSKTLKRRQERINRQSSAGAKEGSPSDATAAATSSVPASVTATAACASLPRTTQNSNEIPEAQARVDSLLLAATAGVHAANKPPMLRPVMTPMTAASSSLLSQHHRMGLGPGGMNPYSRQSSLLPGRSLGTAALGYITPSLASLMAAGNTTSAPLPHYTTLLMNRELEHQAMLRRTLVMGNLGGNLNKLKRDP